MNSACQSLLGNMVAIVTPFKDNDDFDHESHFSHINWLIENGVNGIVSLGTTGESPTVPFKEHEEILRFVVRTVDHRVPVIAGIGGNSTKEAVRLTEYAQKSGADAGLSVVPYYNKPSQEGLYRHFVRICEAGGTMPIILYNVPGRTVVGLKPETTLRIRDKVNNVAGIKEASSDLTAVQFYVENGLPVFCGEDALNFPMLALGAQGVISVVSNFYPRMVSKLVEVIREGDLVRARIINVKMVAAAQAAFIDTNPIPTKFICAHMGLIKSEHLRQPLVPLSNENRKLVLQTL